MNHPLVSVVILAWNRKEDVRESLKRIRRQSYGFIETIIVDNGSTDGTPDMVEREFPEVRLIRMFKNIGIEAYNIGFENAHGRYIVILDDDSFPREDAVARMVDKFENDPQLGVVAFDVRNYFRYEDVVKTASPVDTSDELDKPDAHEAVAKNYWLSFNGAGAGVRRDLLKAIGYYPEEFFLYYNEADTALRIWDAGYTIKFFSDVVSYHKYSPQNRSSWRAPFYYTRNAFWLVWKNYPTDMLLRMTLRLIYGCLFHSLEQRTAVYLRAMWAAFRDMDQALAKRKPVRRDIARNLRIPFNLTFTFYR